MNISLMVLSTLGAILLLAALAGCGSTDPEPASVGATARAEMSGPNGEAMGSVTLTQARWGVLVSADLSGLAPGGHGFHIHETGRCEPDFSAAGDHFAPDGSGHGYLGPEGHHAGDMPNVYAADNGAARGRRLQTGP